MRALLPRFLLALAAAMAAEEAIYRLAIAPLGDALPLWGLALPWLPVGAAAGWHGWRAARWRDLLLAAAAGALVIQAFDVAQALALGAAPDKRLIFEQPLKWAAVSFPLWTGLLLALQAPARGVRLGLAALGGER